MSKKSPINRSDTPTYELDSHSLKILNVKKLVLERDNARRSENFESFIQYR